MIRTFAMGFALLLLPATALAQDEGGLGLDLSAPDEPAKEPEEETPPPRRDERTSSSSASSADDRAPATTRESLLEGERDVTVEDRVKSVQRKLYLKKGRFEVSPMLSYAVNDPYYTKWGATVRGSYFLQDTLSVGARFLWVNVVANDDVRVATKTFQSEIFKSVPQWGVIGNAEWSPIYGKFAFLNNILHFDAYVVGGLGIVTTETSALPGRGPHPAAVLGLGARFVALDYLAVTGEVVNTSYVDQPNGTTKGVTQNLMTLNVGASFFFPFKSTSQEAQ